MDLIKKLHKSPAGGYGLGYLYILSEYLNFRSTLMLFEKYFVDVI